MNIEVKNSEKPVNYEDSMKLLNERVENVLAGRPLLQCSNNRFNNSYSFLVSVSFDLNLFLQHLKKDL